LGVVVHGPAILAGSAALGVVAGVRCVFAHPSGVHLPVVAAASGIYAEAADRVHRGSLKALEQAEKSQPGRGDVRSDPLRTMVLTVQVNGRRGPAHPYQEQSSGGNDHFDLQADYWIPELPGDELIEVTTSWPEIGLEEHTTVLSCGHLDDLAGRVYPLRIRPGHDQDTAPASAAQAEVPHLVGLTVPEARLAGQQAGVVVTSADPDGPPLGALTWPGTWVVTAQHPAAGTLLQRGGTVVVEFQQRPGHTGAGESAPR
jgi:hypothetical protein